MEKYIILKMQHQKHLNSMYNLSDLAICDAQNRLRTFNTIDEADAFREKYQINGQIVELPIY